MKFIKKELQKKRIDKLKNDFLLNNIFFFINNSFS